MKSTALLLLVVAAALASCAKDKPEADSRQPIAASQDDASPAQEATVTVEADDLTMLAKKLNLPEGHSLGEAHETGNLRVLPILCSSAKSKVHYASLQAALKSKELEVLFVHESKYSATLSIGSYGTTPVLAIEGERITHEGKTYRISRTQLLHTSALAKIHCEKGWISPLDERREIVSQFESCRQHVAEGIEGLSTVGFVCLIDGKLERYDLFDSPALFVGVRDELLFQYAECAVTGMHQYWHFGVKDREEVEAEVPSDQELLAQLQESLELEAIVLELEMKEAAEKAAARQAQAKSSGLHAPVLTPPGYGEKRTNEPDPSLGSDSLKELRTEGEMIELRRNAVDVWKLSSSNETLAGRTQVTIQSSHASKDGFNIVAISDKATGTRFYRRIQRIHSDEFIGEE